MAVIASSTSLPMVGWGALAFRWDHRASFGTQKMLAARYSSGSSGSAPSFVCASSSACFASNASDVLEEDQAEDNVLVLGGIHVVTKRVGGLPECGLEAEISPIPFLFVLSLPRSRHWLCVTFHFRESVRADVLT
jgi:hypothetical protein